MFLLRLRASRAHLTLQVVRCLAALVVLTSLLLSLSCRHKGGGFVIALGDPIRTIDPIGSPSVDAASERVRTLIFNSLVKKDANFDYVGELASSIQRSDDGVTFTFTLRDGVKFQDGRPLTSADAKYTLDLVFASSFAKSASFFEVPGSNNPQAPTARTSYIKSVSAPDAKTVVVTLTKPWVGLLSNLVPVAIIPKDSYESQKTHPLGTGAFKFIRYDSSQGVVDLEGNADYWEGAPHINSLRVRVIADTNALQAELQAGRVDIAPLPTSLSPDSVKRLGQDPSLQVLQFQGSNLVLLTFNTSAAPMNDARVRQAICYAIDREGLIRDLVLGQGKIAHSILPEESWAYTPGVQYSYNPEKAKQLLEEAGYHNSQKRFDKPLVYRISGSSVAARQYAGVIQNALKQVGIDASIEAAETNTHLDELRRGNFQIAYGQWVGGNQDPIFYKDLFSTSEIPTEARASRNRSRYSNPELDTLLAEAITTWDRQKGRALYAKIQDIVSRDAPVFPLFYQANIVIAKKNVENIKVDASGDWGFVRNLTVK
jgi:peptide/nickel transport system substrate-binding protein